MKRLLAVALVMTAVLFGGSASAVEDLYKTVFGPETCSINKGRTNVQTFSFETAAPNEGTIMLGTLIVTNGDEGEGGVISAVIKLNGEEIVGPETLEGDHNTLEIPVRLARDNTLFVKIKGASESYLKLQIDYEVGPTGPIFSGPQQYPFLCRAEEAGLGQPLVDNHDKEGIVVDGGYCKDCTIPTRIDYFYLSEDGRFYLLNDRKELPSDIAKTTTADGLTVDFIVRLERGTINRFLYGIAMLAPFDFLPQKGRHQRKFLKKIKKCREGWDTSAWNGKLVYQFQGGVGIGHQQGSDWATDMISDEGASDGGPLYADALAKGYAVAFSTGTTTDTHYNMQLSAETMKMVKGHFIERYGKPVYTVGVGGSGGSIQQYFIGQNYPGLLDGAVPQYSYSDMITQTIYVGDCSLLEHYFDVVAPSQGDFTFGGVNIENFTKIGSVAPRTWIEGLSSNDDMKHPVYTPLSQALHPDNVFMGSTECVNGWLGLLPLCINPVWTDTPGLDRLYPLGVAYSVKWTHWNDLANIYGVDGGGYAPNSWDNVGVQYGLQALKDGKITMAQFLDINARIGGWKQPQEMETEGYPFSGKPFSTADFDPWSIRNSTSTFETGQYPAPRTGGNIDAMHKAYESGHVFVGKIDLPIIDARHYLDPVLNMHHAQQSFATRQRMIDGKGNADNQLIWFAAPYYDNTMYAFDVLDKWIYNIQNQVYGEGVVENKPADALDKCFDADGNIIAQGPDVWDGILNDKPEGACTKAFPLYSTSRIVAGGDIKGDVFKCHLIPVKEAIKRKFYGKVKISRTTRDRLEEIFPNGVCDYSQGDAGRPENF